MNTHPYLRAYAAGVFLPTLVLPLLLTVFIVARIVLRVPVPIEQAMIFPMAVVPSLFGLWNMLYLFLQARTHLPIGVRLGVLALGAHAVVWFQAWHLPYTLIAPGFLAALAGYYLVWKYIVGFLNRVLGIA